MTDGLHRVLAWLESHQPATLTLAGLQIVIIALVDARVVANVSLGFLYLFPLLLTAAVMRPTYILVLSLLCAYLREAFSPFHLAPGYAFRIVLVFAAFASAGMLVSQLNRSRLMVLLFSQEREREAQRRREVEDHLRVLVATSPLAILTTDSEGRILRPTALLRGCSGSRPSRA